MPQNSVIMKRNCDPIAADASFGSRGSVVRTGQDICDFAFTFVRELIAWAAFAAIASVAARVRQHFYTDRLANIGVMAAGLAINVGRVAGIVVNTAMATIK